MTISGGFLFVMNTGSENIGVIDLRTNRLMRTISVALPLPSGRDDRDGFGNDWFADDWFGRGHDAKGKAFGAQPSSIAVVGSVGYVSVYNIKSVRVG